MPLVYAELRRMAKRYMRGQTPGSTLQTTALVHEAYLHLLDANATSWRDRTHFYAVCAQIMRRILIDSARSRASQKRGGGQRFDAAAVNPDEIPDVTSDRATDFVVLDDALHRLDLLDSRKAKVVELRFFGGLTVDETAEVLDVSPQTVMRDWRLARVWLAKEMGVSPGSYNGT
jgi:RNA polymerase sigma factor (TIGR02999 family)